MIQIWSQVLMYGIIIGSMYGLAAVGIALIFGVMDVLQIAHGSIIMLGGYFCFWLFRTFHLDPYLALPVTMFMFFLAGVFLFKVVFSPTTKLPTEDKVKNSMLVAFGLILVLDNLATILFTGNIRTVNPFYSGLAFGVWSLRIPVIGMINLVVAGVFITVLHIFLRKTYIGKSIRATAQNSEAASLSGIHVGRTYSIAMGIATLMGAVAGVLILLFSGIDPTIGMDWTLKALLITILAGTGNVGGVFICGLFFGVLEAIGSMFMGPYKDTIGLFLFVIVLIWRPQGLFSRSEG